MARRVLFLFGPTAVGKTEALEALAGRPIEVISADSMQVYRGMDIGTAKPDPALRDRIPHHLIDIRNPDQQYDVGAFVTDANRAIGEILARRRLPIVAGGTGFYFRHLLFGLPETPPSDEQIRERVRRKGLRLGLEAMHAELVRIDPASAQRINPRDRYRIHRALEVYEQTGRPLSSFETEGAPRRDVEVTLHALRRDRAELRERIARRVESMFAAGLRDEVERLVRDGYGPGDRGMRAIGYREFFDASGALRPATDDPRIAHEIIVASRRYAKRQETFFRGLPGVTDIAADGPAAVERIVDRLCARPSAELDSD